MILAGLNNERNARRARDSYGGTQQRKSLVTYQGFFFVVKRLEISNLSLQAPDRLQV